MRNGLIIFLIAMCGFEAMAQRQVSTEGDGARKDRRGSSVIDDSTKQVYGPTTTEFTYLRNIKYNNPKSWNVDTLVYDFHKFQFIAQRNNTYQNLGNIGTAFAPIYPTTPDIIGGRIGFNNYDEYYIPYEDIKIYDTKSPYSKFGIIWGGKGRSVTNVEFSRNIDERSNFSFQYRGLYIDKQIERERRGDRMALGHYYNLGGNYATKNGRYKVLGNFSRQNHVVDEYGGIDPGQDTVFILTDYFEENRQGFLSDVQTRDLRTDYHLYQQYKINDQMQVYHEMDRYKQLNDFTNTSSSGIETDTSYFGSFIALDTIPIKDRTKIIHRQHEVGIKGDIGKTFYSFYYKGREVNVDYKYLLEDTLDYGTYYMENYAGFNLRFGNDSTSYIETYGEYLFDENYKLGAKIQNKWFYAEGRSSRYLPTYVQRAYLGRHDQWLNDFESTLNTEIKAGINFKLGGLYLQPEASYNIITDYIYFADRTGEVDSTIRPIQPKQVSGDISIIKGQLKAGITFLKHFTLKTMFIYSEVAGDEAEAISLPQLLINGQLAYTNILYEGNLQLQFGFDFHQRSAYFANAYDASTMQYYRQNEFKTPAYPVIDVFLNVKINRGRAFLKYNNIYERIKQTGYFLTPYYPAQTTILDFGIDWALYD
ncbi:putative porin [Fulvivirga sp.]|uniref:putative porin n=1 Tax=Fulvivirga sp. TaxID=1931237 RepID=UPI0032EDC6C6